MLSHCHIREGKPEDAEAVTLLYCQLVEDDSVRVLPEVISDLKSSPSGFLLIAENGDQIVGTALLSICQDVMYGHQPFAVMENIVVSNTCLRSGVGSLLMSKVEKTCIAHECSKILLSTSRGRLGAHQFFQKHGFSDQVKIGFVKYRSQFGNLVEPANKESAKNDTATSS
ncbi:MAG: GNAT family N-acetyltransferase [Verrucomicrobiota bacterium]